jgi:hypothetical protein
MGGGSWTGQTYNARQRAASAAGYASSFTWDEDIRNGRRSAGIHPNNDPRKKAGRVVREVVITDEHPDPTPIAVVFDVTGSMGDVPRLLQQRLPELQTKLRAEPYGLDPQILFGAVGDARTDDFPLQMGQFESDNRSDEQLEALYLEGNGGGQGSETYELAALYLYAAAVMGPFEKHGKKGILVTMGDERPAGVVAKNFGRHTFTALTGLPLEADVDAATLADLVAERFDWFHLVIDSRKLGGMYTADHSLGAWQALLGKGRVGVLGEPGAVADAVALIVGVREGKITMDEGLADLRSTAARLAIQRPTGAR